MKRTPADLIAAMKAAYRPDAPATLELVPGDHEAIAKLEQQQAWGAMVRAWLIENKAVKHSLDCFAAHQKAKAEGGEK